MPKQSRNTPPLADWTVSLWPVGDNPADDLTVRASRLKVREDSYVLEDADGGLVFVAPAAGVRYVKIRTEDDRKRESRHCLPGCDRVDGHDGRELGACMRNGEAIVARGTGPKATS